MLALDTADVGLGDEIAKRREALGWSQNELARRAGLNHPTVQKIESGTSKDPGISYVVRIALALGVSLDELVASGVQHKRSKPRNPLAELDDHEKRIVALERAIRPK